MQKKVCSILAILMLLYSITAFAHTANIENSGKQTYKAIRLTPEIYNHARENLADLMLYDEANEPIPYFINRFSQSSNEVQQSHSMRLIHSFVKDEWFYYDYTLAARTDGDVLATSIEVSTKNQGFAKEAQLFGSHDNINWELVKEDTLYRVEDNQKLFISFPAAQKYTHYRFRLLNNLERISFDEVKLIYSDKVINRDYFKETIQPEFTITEQDKNTVIQIKSLKNMEIEEIILDTSSIFRRNVIYANGRSKTLYHLLFGQTKYQDLVLPFDGFHNRSDILELTIVNRDDKPIDIEHITVVYRAAELVFEGRQGNYLLSFGDSDAASPPVYDIAGYQNLIIKEGYDLLRISSVVLDEQGAEKEPYDYSLIFNIVIVFITALLGFVIVFKLKSISKEEATK